jgi:hypothetical protein
MDGNEWWLHIIPRNDVDLQLVWNPMDSDIWNQMNDV